MDPRYVLVCQSALRSWWDYDFSCRVAAFPACTLTSTVPSTPVDPFQDNSPEVRSKIDTQSLMCWYQDVHHLTNRRDGIHIGTVQTQDITIP